MVELASYAEIRLAAHEQTQRAFGAEEANTEPIEDKSACINCLSVCNFRSKHFLHVPASLNFVIAFDSCEGSKTFVSI